MIRVGVLSPHTAPGAEAEFPLMAPDRVSTVVSRVPVAGTSADALRAAARDALSAPVPGPVDVLTYASSSTAYALGPDAESRLVERLAERWAVPACSTSASAVEALRSLRVERVALVHPPWFGVALSELGVDYFRGQGFSVAGSSRAEVTDDPARVTPDEVVDWVSGHVGDDADAVYLGGNGFRAAGAIEALEARLGRPVLESNQVLLWAVLARTGIPADVRGFGTLFARR